MPSPLEELNKWQALATRARVPLYQLLGGPTRHRIRTLNPYERRRQDAGGPRVHLLEATPATAADAAALTAGSSDFAVRCPASMNGADALKLARAIQPHGPQWISHPDAAVVRRLASQTTVAVAASSQHTELLKDETADLLLLDLPSLGLGSCMALAALAETHYVGVALMGCSQQPWRAAGLHLAAALPNFLAIEAGELPLDREGFTELPR